MASGITHHYMSNFSTLRICNLLVYLWSFMARWTTNTVHCWLFMMKRFCCSTSLLSFPTKVSWLPAFTSCLNTLSQKFVKTLLQLQSNLWKMWNSSQQIISNIQHERNFQFNSLLTMKLRLVKVAKSDNTLFVNLAGHIYLYTHIHTHRNSGVCINSLPPYSSG